MITRFQIREDVEAIERAMVDETFMRATDPSIAVLTFLERIATHVGAIKHAYAHSASKRASLPADVAPYIAAIRDACDALEDTFDAPAEDENRSLESDRWGG